MSGATVLVFCPGSGRPDARVAEWQTRRLQVPVPARAWRFNSSLAHFRRVVERPVFFVNEKLAERQQTTWAVSAGRWSRPPSSKLTIMSCRNGSLAAFLLDFRCLAVRGGPVAVSA